VTEVPVFCSECERKGKAVELCVIREYWYNALMQKCPKEQGQAVTLGGIESGASRREAESTPTPENLSADKAVTSTPAQEDTTTIQGPVATKPDAIKAGLCLLMNSANW